MPKLYDSFVFFFFRMLLLLLCAFNLIRFSWCVVMKGKSSLAAHV
jgi:hypothetical protein